MATNRRRPPFALTMALLAGAFALCAAGLVITLRADSPQPASVLIGVGTSAVCLWLLVREVASRGRRGGQSD